MLEQLEKDLSIDINLSDRQKMLETFVLAKSLQLPVVDQGNVVGLLAVYDLCGETEPEIDVKQLMITDFVVAGMEEGVFSFTNSKQDILPFVDEQGKLEGFVNRIMQKCYLPNEEYMNVIEEGLHALFNDIENAGKERIDELKRSFDAIFETNYDGIYITVGKGDTLSVNPESTYAQELEVKDITRRDNQVDVRFQTETENCRTVNVLQHVQKRQEFSVSENVISDGGIIRVVNNIRSFEKIRQELEATQTLAKTYKTELEVLKAAVFNTSGIVAESTEMKQVIELALKVSKVDTTALIQGQSGVGKGIISRFIHENSDRSGGPFIKIDCGSIPENLLESELFGYVKGAFTGAEKAGKIGQIELANHGTVFLDEIGELPLNLQTKLLRVLQDRQIMRVGSNALIDVDIRIIAATNRNLKEMVGQRKFREDLFYRLNVVPIHIPPLRSRVADIKVLIDRCLDKFNQKYGMAKSIEKRAVKKLIDYGWPGNVRELENVVEYLIVTTEQDQISEEDLPASISERSLGQWISLENTRSLKEAVRLMETRLLKEAMKKCKSTEEMALMLKIDRSTVTRKLQKYGIKTNFTE